jgi:hypothetical protein
VHNRPLICLGVALVFPESLLCQKKRPCPPVRSVEERLSEANTVLFGEVTYAHECMGFGQGDGDRVVIPDCIGGQRADLRVEKLWKGNVKVGDTVGLVVAGRTDSIGLFWRPREKHVVFADVELLGRMWWGSANACEAAAGISDSALITALDARRDGSRRSR